jgi:hypothetical protein
VTLIIVSIYSLETSCAIWWNPSWIYRRRINVSEESNNELINYSINITFDTYSLIKNGKMKSDCSDIRLIEDNLNKEFSIVDCNSFSSNIFFRTSISNLSKKNNIFIYYGNNLAIPKNISFNFFYDWFDDFSSNSSIEYNSIEGNWEWDPLKKLIIGTGYNSAPVPDTFAYRYLVKNMNIENGIIEGKIYLASKENIENKYVDAGFSFLFEDYFNGYGFRIQKNGLPTKSKWKLQKIIDGDALEEIDSKNPNIFPYQEWFELKIIFYKGNISFYKNGIYFGNCTDSTYENGTFGLYMDRGGQAFFDDLRVRKYVEPEPTVSLGPEEVYNPSKISILLSTQKQVFVNETSPIITTINYNENPLLNLNISNFELFFNNESLTIDNIQDHNNGTYLLETKISSNILGSNTFKLKLNYKGEIEENTTEIILLSRPVGKVLIITDSTWQNYISSVSTRNPVLIYDSERKYIDYFITKYQPDQIFLLGPSLTFPIKTYSIDSPDTLIKVFYNVTNIIIPSNKEVAIASTMINFPILINPSDETIEYLDPAIIFNFSSIQEIEDIFIRRNPTIDYFILANKEHENSILASSLAIKKNGFIILTDGSPNEFRDKMISKFNLFKLPDSYQFEQDIYLVLIEAPHFLVEDPVLESKNDDGNEIITDSPYADIDGDEYLDLSLGRMKGNQEQISYQIEFSEMLQENKKALIISAYNTPGKVSDILYSGGTMPGIFLTELELRKRGFNVTKIVEKRVEYDELNFTILEKLRDIAEEFRTLSQTTYDSFFWEIFGDVSKIILIAKAGNHVIYPYHEFDWRDTWQSIITLEPEFPKHLPILNITNLIKYTPENQVILYLSKGNATHWLIPENSTDWSTYYLTFDPSNIPFNPNFYYIHHPFGYNVSSKLLKNGTLASIGPTANTYFFNSGIVGVEFFKKFENSIGKALTLTKNRNLEFSNFGKYTQKTYKKEYYTETLLGDPSLIFDPYLNLRFSGFVKCKHNLFTQTFYIKPEYYMASNNNEKFLIFENADDYLLILNKPAIPIYKKSFILPVGSEILDISVRGVSKKTFNDITLPIIYPDPEYFEKENFTGTYPEEIYWYYTSSLLDDRKILDLFFSPVVYSSDGNAEVFKKIKVSVKYKSPFEISRLRATDTFKHKKSFIFFSVCNQLDRKIKANTTFRIQTSEFEDIVEREFTFRPGLNFRMLKYENTTQEGDYSVSMVLKHEDIIAGPKYTSFKVKDKHWPCFRDYCKK